MSPLSLYPHTPDDVLSRVIDKPEAFPREADVVIIGGGIIGAASAFYLAAHGLKTVLIEKDQVAAQQSGRNWGFVRSQYRDPAELPLAMEALSIWPTLEATLGRDIGWRQTGCIFIAENEAEYEAFAHWRDSAKDIATGATMLSGEAVEGLVPAFAAKVPGALYTETDGQAEPALATLAFARAAEAKGARILEDCGALAIDTAGGRIAGVVTEHGRIRAATVICAAGAVSHRLLAGLGLALPQQVVRSTVSLTAPLAALSAPCFCGLGLGLRQRADGSCILAADAASDVDLTLSSFRGARYFVPELLRYRKTFSFNLGRPFFNDLGRRLMGSPNAAIEPRRPRIPPNARRATRTAALFQRLFGSAEPVPLVKSWAGEIDVMPDALPVIDTPTQAPGLIVATGFSGHGFGLGPAVGRSLAFIVAGGQPSVSLDAFRLDRFARGTYARAHAPL
jgi:glycine/D-amino acid oxidase-like deaminating enzyme